MIRIAIILLLLVLLPVTGYAQFETCTDRHCNELVQVDLNHRQWSQIRSLFKDVDSAAKERERIAEAIARFESIVGPMNGTWRDKGKNPGTVSSRGQLDCISESINSTTYLQQLERLNLLKWHIVKDRVVRQRWIVSVHWTAVVEEKQSGQQYAVDSWYRDNGSPAIVIPLDAWHRGEEKI